MIATVPAPEAPPVPAKQSAARAARAARRARRVDAGLVGITVAFAFLAASFAATNSDLWLHLAAGRLIATGGYHFGVDPFAYTTEGVYWANHAWLSDLLLYGAYRAVGGAGLVVLKALGVAALAGVMLRTALRPGGPVWLAAGCTLLAVLAMSPRLVLQPQCLSLLLLAVCLYLLRAGGRADRALPVLIALWVNLDSWFLLGPVLVALVLLGERLNRADPDTPPRPRWLLPACLLACLLSPHHVRALTLPPELSPAVWASELRDDPRLTGYFASPWQNPRDSLAAWAYFALLAAGVISFVANRRAVAGWRGVVWLAFAGLGGWQARLVPFFAVVAGPIAALNFQDVLPAAPRAGAGAWAGRVAVLVTGVGLLVLTWPGWLQGFRNRDRAAGWDVAPDPSLVRVSETLARWREQNLLPAGGHVFTTHPAVAHHLAWFAPGEKGFLDSRLPLFAPVAREYVRISRALGVIPGDEPVPGPDGMMRERGIACAVLYDPDRGALLGGLPASATRQGLAAGLREVVARPDRWELLSIDGQAVVAAPKGAVPGSLPRFDPARLAYGPATRGGLPRPPADGPSSLPVPAPWWELAANRSRPRTWEGDAAAVYLRLFEVYPAGAAANRSPATPLLAARAARSSLAAVPDDNSTWLALGLAYWFLGQREGAAAPDWALLRYLRHAQAAGALFQAATLYPDSASAHEALAAVYADRPFLDLALQHRQAHLRLARRAGPYPGEPAPDHAARLARIAEAAEKLEYAVQDQENLFLVRTHTLAGDPLARARIAVGLGLGGRAVDTLVKSHPDLYGADGLRLLLDLLLQTGQIAEARVLLDREELRRNPAFLDAYAFPGGEKDGRAWGYRLPAYDWFDFCQCAAAGRYDRAAIALDRIHARLRQESAGLGPRAVVTLAAKVVSEAGLAAPPGSVRDRLLIGFERQVLAELVRENGLRAAERADLFVLGGLLRLERGAPAAAADAFATAAAEYERAKDIAPALPGRPLAVRYLDAIRKQGK